MTAFRMNRRDAIRHITGVLGATVSAPTLAGLLAGCESPPEGTSYAARSLGRAEMARVRTLAEIIIPETPESPGAEAARVHDFVDLMLTDFFSETERDGFRSGLQHVDAVATSLFGEGFDGLAGAERREVVAALDAEAFPDPDGEPELAATLEARLARGDVPFMRTLKELVVSGYYTSEIGQTVELHRPPFGPYEADVPLEGIGRTWA